MEYHSETYGDKRRELHWWELRDIALKRKFPNPDKPYRKRWSYDTEFGWSYYTWRGKRHRLHAYGGRNNVIDTIRLVKNRERRDRRWKKEQGVWYGR